MIYREKPNIVAPEKAGLNEDNLVYSFLLKRHEKTTLVGVLKKEDAIIGLRFYDPIDEKYLDIAPMGNIDYISSSLPERVPVINLQENIIPYNKTVLTEWIDPEEKNRGYRAVKVYDHDSTRVLWSKVT